MPNEFFEEITEEFNDFVEDFKEHLTKKPPSNPTKTKTTLINGVKVAVRPAYLFAERIDNLLKLIFGSSILISALASTFLGFIKLSDLLEVLINNPLGRAVMILIGLSYIILGVWKLMHINEKN